MKQYKTFTLLVILIILSTLSPALICKAEEDLNIDEKQESYERPVRGKVIEILSSAKEDIEYSGGVLNVHTQLVKVQVVEGPFKYREIEAEHSLNSYFSDRESVRLKKGDQVLLYIESDDYGNIDRAYVSDLCRDRYLIYIILIFFGLLILIGRWKGLKTILSLGITILAVVYVLLPLILKGYSPVLVSVLVCSGIIVVVLLIINGISIKTFSAILGTLTGLIMAGGLALFIGKVARLTGMSNEEAQMLLHIPQNIQFDFQGLLFAGIIIGALGAVMDVGMSIASSIHEIRETDPRADSAQLFRSGMNVGRDIMGTMSNTLILAYTGGALNLLLIFMAYSIPFGEVINGDYMAGEIVRALAGSIGIILTIPVTSFISSWLEVRFS